MTNVQKKAVCLHRVRLIWLMCCAAVLSMAMLGGHAPCALAINPIDQTNRTSLTIEFAPEGAAAEGVAFRLYRVAEMTGFGTFVPCAGYEGLEMNGLSSDGWRTLTRRVKDIVTVTNPPAYRDRHGQGDAVRYVGADGFVRFSDMDVGLYLVVGDRFTRGQLTYVPQPMLVALPNHSDVYHPDHWVYDPVIDVKADIIVEGKTDLTIRKIWLGEKTTANLPPIRVELYANGRHYRTILLSNENNWRYTIEDVDKTVDWTVFEIRVAGYKVTVDYNQANILIINDKEEVCPTPTPTCPYATPTPYWWPTPTPTPRWYPTPTPIYIIVTPTPTPYWWPTPTPTPYWYPTATPTPYNGTVIYVTPTPSPAPTPTPTMTPRPTPVEAIPQTGQLWWPVPLLAAAGMVMIMLGWALRRDYEEE